MLISVIKYLRITLLLIITGIGYESFAVIDSTMLTSFSESWFISAHLSGKANGNQNSFNISEYYVASNIYSEAAKHFENGRFEEARELFDKAAYHFNMSEDIESWANCLVDIAKCYISLNQHPKAFDYLNQSREAAEGLSEGSNLLHARVHHEYGVILLKQGDKNNSIAHLIESITIRTNLRGEGDPELANTYNKLGVNYYMVGDFDKSLAAYNKALEISSITAVEPVILAEIYNNIGIVLKLTGDLVGSLKYYEESVALKEKLLSPDDPNLARTYNNLGNLHRIMGQSEMAMYYFQKAETIFKSNYGQRYPMVGKIYSNMGIIYKDNGDFGKSLQYLNYAKSVLEGNPSNSEEIASVYNNLGNVHYELNDYEQALLFYKQSVDTREQGQSIFLSRSYSNIALCYYELQQFNEASAYHQLSIDYRIKYFGKDHYMLADEYMNYGQFYVKTGDPNKGLDLYKSAYTIYVNNFGQKHPRVSNCLATIGGFYYEQKNVFLALQYYQKALVAVVEDFDDKSNFYSNPSLDQKILSKTDLLFALSKKAMALKDYYTQLSHDLRDMRMSLASYELALDLMDNIRIGHLTGESKLELAKNQKDLFVNAISTAYEAFTITQAKEYQDIAFQFTERGKAAMLYDFMRENDAKQYAHIPDSLLSVERKIKEDITLYQKLIYEEVLKPGQERDSTKMSRWEEELFKSQEQQKDLIAFFNINYPKYYQYKYTNKICSIEEIRSNLDDNDVLVEYFLGSDVLYTFCVSRNETKILKQQIDSSLYRYIDQLPNNQTLDQVINDAYTTYTGYVNSSFNLYRILLEPVKNEIAAKDLIIIPDGILGYVSFESLLTDEVYVSSVDYKSLPYLIRKHTINYGYSGTLLVNSIKSENNRPVKDDLLAFAPVYFSSNGQDMSLKTLPVYRTRGEELLDLPATRKEVMDISKIFSGDVYINNYATVNRFKEIAANYRILHIATHGIVDNINPLHSKLVFSPLVNGEKEDNALYYGDLFNLELNAELAVLSACNTGYGKNSEGEGIMALARGFMYSGVPSLVISLWSVEDESTATIMKGFYQYLKEGHSKDESLRLAKLDYLNTTDNVGASPYYWSGFVNIGNNNPLQLIHSKFYYFALLLLLIPATILVYLRYSRRRNSV
jgi:CHAT domain-containing protein/Tfp pilus assembly protein PilF